MIDRKQGTLLTVLLSSPGMRRRTNVAAFAPPPPTSNSIFIFGLGYVGRPLALSLLQRGWTVAGITRSPFNPPLHGVHTGHTQGEKPSAQLVIAKFLNSATHILSTVAPDEQGDPILREYSQQLSAARPVWMGYISTSSVYGDHNGEFVTEESKTRNKRASSIRRLHAEERWGRIGEEKGVGLDVFRAAGIYGPGRNTIRALMRDPNLASKLGDSIHKPVSLVHVDDIVRVIIAAAEGGRSRGKEIFNVADDLPGSKSEFIALAMGILQQAGVVLGEGDDGVQRKYTRDLNRVWKRVSNAKMKRDLVTELKYPTYREGLTAIGGDLFPDKAL